MKSFEDTLDYLYAKLPMFTRQGRSALRLDLNNTLALTQHLGNPHTKFPSLHIAGTNGKGSVSSMLAAVLAANGYKTGLYTSPHLVSFTERIRINGKKMPNQAVIQWVNQHKDLIEKINPSFFEVTFAMAMDYFEQQKVDIAVVEVGLGGRLDSTNIISPLASVITNISYDHTDILGDTLSKIAAEKAGIIKKNTPIIIGETHPETLPVFIEKAKAENAPLTQADITYPLGLINSSFESQTFQVSTPPTPPLTIKIDLIGHYQAANLKTVLATLATLQQLGWNISTEKMLYALANIKELSGLQGRMMCLRKRPFTLCDTGHNEAGIRFSMTQLAEINHTSLHIVWGMVKDKDHDKVLKLLPPHATYYFVAVPLPRSLPPNELATKAQSYGLAGQAYPSVEEGTQAAIQAAQKEKQPLVFIGGSTFVVGEVLKNPRSYNGRGWDR